MPTCEIACPTAGGGGARAQIHAEEAEDKEEEADEAEEGGASDAQETLQEAHDQHKTTRRSLFFGISGPTRAGKSRTGKSLVPMLKDTGITVCLVHQDDFFDKAYTKSNIDWDHPDSIDHVRLRKEILAARLEHDVVILEGFKAFHDVRLMKLMDACVMLDLTHDSCRELRVKSGCTTSYFDEYVWPNHLLYLRAFESNRDLWPTTTRQLDVTRMSLDDTCLFVWNMVKPLLPAVAIVTGAAARVEDATTAAAAAAPPEAVPADVEAALVEEPATADVVSPMELLELVKNVFIEEGHLNPTSWRQLTCGTIRQRVGDDMRHRISSAPASSAYVNGAETVHTMSMITKDMILEAADLVTAGNQTRVAPSPCRPTGFKHTRRVVRLNYHGRLRRWTGSAPAAKHLHLQMRAD